MTSTPPESSHGRRRAETPPTRAVAPATAPTTRRLARAERRGIRPLAMVGLGAGVAVIVLAVTAAVLPTQGAPDEPQAPPAAQSLEVVAAAPLAGTVRDSYSATPGVDTYVAGGTNRDWASLVLHYGEWPVTEENVTVIMRWMRQENYEKTWWNRNNPLNNGWGSGGGSGLGSYPNLRVAAENAAEALHTHPGYSAIRAGFAASAATSVTEAAIWASPWASSHYANGAHWHYTPVQVLKAPAEAW